MKALALIFGETPLALRTSRVQMPRVRLGTWLNVWQERRDLATLQPHQLRDIGVSASEAEREAARPFWDVTSPR